HAWPVSQRRRDRNPPPRPVLGPLAETRTRANVAKGRSIMKCSILVIASLAALATAAGNSSAQPNVRVGWCAKTVTLAAAAFAIATKRGWFAQAGIKVELLAFPGSTDCVKSVATKDVAYSLPSIEPLAIIRPQGVKAKNFYTAYQGNIYGIAVPENSPVKSFADLKGRNIGVTSMASGGVIIAR